VFSRTTGTGQRYQTIVGQDPPHVAHFSVAADKARQTYREMLGSNGIGCAKRRELVVKVSMAQLHHPFGPGQITQLVGTKIDQPHVGREPVDDQIVGRARQHGLPAVRQITQPCRPIDRRTDVIAVAA